MMLHKSEPQKESLPITKSKQTLPSTASSHTEHYYPSRKWSDQNCPAKKNYFATPNISSTEQNTSPVIQRYFIINDYDITSAFHAAKRSQPMQAEKLLDEEVTKIAIQMLKELDEKIKTEKDNEEIRYLNHVIQSIRKDEGGLLRAQLKKWIRDAVGDKTTSKNKVFGQKFQPRAYRSYYEAAIALVGWVDAKKGRKDEKDVAQKVLQNPVINYHLDSVFLRILNCILNSPLTSEIASELQLPDKPITVRHKDNKQIVPRKWDIYRSYYNQSSNPLHQLPQHSDVLQQPNRYDIRMKSGVLHDLMHYFSEKFGDDFLFSGLPEFQATTPGGRKPYNRPTNSQIMGNMADAKAGRAPLNLANVVYSTEEQSDSYKFARRNCIPMYGRHSYSAARMMGLAKQVGAQPEEISAVAWAIMAYWRIHYDHTSIPYHTTHEIMDFTPAFGLNYNPADRFAGFEALQNQHFLDFLTRNAHTDWRALQTLMAYHSNHFERAKYFLMHQELWNIPAIMHYLKTTVLPIDEFVLLPAERLYAFFSYNEETRTLFQLLPPDRQKHVQICISRFRTV